MKYLIDIPDGTVYGYDEDEKILIFPEKDFIEASEVSNLIYLPNVVPYEESMDNKFYNIAWMDGYEKGVEAGRDDAWKFARNLLNYTNKDWEDLMNLLLVSNCSYQEAKDMYEEWEREKNEIQIGDEVKDEELGDKGIVTCVLATRCDVLWLDGTVSEDVLMSELCKTGRHFDEVEDFLKKMKERL